MWKIVEAVIHPQSFSYLNILSCILFFSFSCSWIALHFNVNCKVAICFEWERKTKVEQEQLDG